MATKKKAPPRTLSKHLAKIGSKGGSKSSRKGIPNKKKS